MCIRDSPYCGETITLVVDDSAGDQQYVEDCHVCCKPIEVRVRVDDDGAVDVVAWGQDCLLYTSRCV